MTGKAGRSGRPLDPQAKGRAVMVRMDDEEKAGLELLVRARNEELAAEGVHLKAPDVLRWLVRRELEARDLHVTPKAKAKR